MTLAALPSAVDMGLNLGEVGKEVAIITGSFGSSVSKCLFKIRLF